MSDMLSTAAAWLSEQLQAYASETVIYSRGAQQVSFQATFGRQLLSVTDRHGHVRVERADRDFVFPPDTLEAALMFPPERGDTVTMADGDVFEVSAVGSEAAWRYADQHKAQIRVHTKQVS